MEKRSFKYKLFNNKYMRKYREVFVMMIDLIFVFISFSLSYLFRYGLKIFGISQQHIIFTFALALIVYLISFKLFKIGKSLW